MSLRAAGFFDKGSRPVRKQRLKRSEPAKLEAPDIIPPPTSHLHCTTCSGLFPVQHFDSVPPTVTSARRPLPSGLIHSDRCHLLLLLLLSTTGSGVGGGGALITHPKACYPISALLFPSCLFNDYAIVNSSGWGGWGVITEGAHPNGRSPADR